MVEAVELDAASLVGADPDGGRGQAVVLSSHHQGGEDGGAVRPPPPTLGAVARRVLLPEGGEVPLHHRGDALHRRRLRLRLPVGGGQRHLHQLLLQAAVRHGAVEAADGADAGGEGLGLQGALRLRVELQLQRRRRRRRRKRRAEVVRLGLVETPPLRLGVDLRLRRRQVMRRRKRSRRRAQILRLGLVESAALLQGALRLGVDLRLQRRQRRKRRRRRAQILRLRLVEPAPLLPSRSLAVVRKPRRGRSWNHMTMTNRKFREQKKNDTHALKQSKSDKKRLLQFVETGRQYKLEDGHVSCIIRLNHIIGIDQNDPSRIFYLELQQFAATTKDCRNKRARPGRRSPAAALPLRASELPSSSSTV